MAHGEAFDANDNPNVLVQCVGCEGEMDFIERDSESALETFGCPSCGAAVVVSLNQEGPAGEIVSAAMDAALENVPQN